MDVGYVGQIDILELACLVVFPLLECVSGIEKV